MSESTLTLQSRGFKSLTCANVAMDSVSCAVGYKLSPVVFSQYLFRFWQSGTILNAELAISSSCLQRTHGCTDNYHCITLTLKKTYKHVDSQASSPISKWIYLR